MATRTEKSESLSFLPDLLFDLWVNHRTGSLQINQASGQKTFCLLQGEVSAVNKYFPEKEFVDWLIETGKIQPPLRLNHNLLGSEKASSVLAILIEQGFIQPDEAFHLVADFLETSLSEFFIKPDWPVTFVDENFTPEDIGFTGLSLPAIILKGLKKISRIEAYRPWLPPEETFLFRQVPAYVSKLNLSPADVYIWNLLQTPRSFSWLLENSWLGPSETRKIILVLTCLRLLDFNPRESGYIEESQAGWPDLEKSLDLFNEKANLIHRYIAKQLGPVAYNLLEKSYREVQDGLDPIFLNLEIKPDGSFEPRAMLRISLNDLEPRQKKILLRGFDEILATEILLVKKTLGNQHEENLIKLLSRSGETT
ncbi:MAG: hypothetical protein PHU81_05965 [Acidobacteriota bacterium]|nr:hypothetical protein [Acidobacteriota bacterium]